MDIKELEQEIVEAIDYAAKEVCSTMLPVELKGSESFVRNEKNISTDVISSVHFFGERYMGKIALFTYGGTACHLASAMLGMEFTRVDADVKDCMGEIVNIIAGSAKTKLENKIGETYLLTPWVITGKRLTVSSPPGGEEGLSIDSQAQFSWIMTKFTISKGDFTGDFIVGIQPNSIPSKVLEKEHLTIRTVKEENDRLRKEIDELKELKDKKHPTVQDKSPDVVICEDSTVLSEQDLTVTSTTLSGKSLEDQIISDALLAETARMDTQKLDHLYNLVGELVTANVLISEMAGSIRGIENKNLSHLNRVIKEIQGQVTSLRMVPLKFTFREMDHLVRTVSAKVGKKVRLEISGEEMELDKTVVEGIREPLAHIIVNSIDHGIEPEEERIAKGKPAEGIVQLNALRHGESIIIEVKDDGKGLSKEKILQKAVGKGIVKENTALSDSQVYNLIFTPKFSTAEKVTELSGNGAGMDVVKRDIERLRGRIEISATEGEGTKISIRLPLTLAIIDGMIVQVGEEKYVVPMVSIEESIRPKKEDISTVQKRGELVNVRGDLLPVVRLHQLYNIQAKKTTPWEALILIVEGEGKRCGILVDDLIGQQQIVIKSLGEQFRDVKGISGSAILGDGNVSLILDIDGVMNMALN